MFHVIYNIFKLLGVIVTTNCKFEEHVRYLVSKARVRLFFLRRLKILGADTNTLLETYNYLYNLYLSMLLLFWEDL